MSSFPAGLVAEPGEMTFLDFFQLDRLTQGPGADVHTRARIAARLTQRGLAQRLGSPEQQVQRWEANSYSGVGSERLPEIADALQLQVLETVTYAVPA